MAHSVLLSFTLSKSQCKSNIPTWPCNRTSFSGEEVTASEVTISSSAANSAVIWEIQNA